MKMKIALFLFLTSSLAMNAQDVFKGEHFIEVTGNAQTEIAPNEIDVQIRLREFEENKKKTALESIDKDFFNALKEAGIDRKRVELADAGAKLDKLGKKDKDAFREKTYQIRLTSGAELEKLLENLEPVKTDLVDIVRISHSDLPKLKLDLKIKALQAAKTKAETLLKSIGSEAGKPLMIRDWDVDPVQPIMNMKANTMARFDGVASEEQAVEFKKIKLQSQITAQFEIK
ncbi:MAG: hypothetical protein DI538_15900 [Azospira oryzae]|jgi:uncharacterized protein YggE|nr:MAG: hypothetical protein DI538_15900 [Azospira oryzae]